MDSLTHGLLGLAVGALRRPDAGSARPLSQTDRAVLVACVLAAELPDLDYLWPASDPVLHTLRSHRGFSHSLLAAPLVALGASAIALVFARSARRLPVYGFALLSVVVAHLLADAWTGWGTRLFLPFSEARVTLDWMMVVDPLFTVPLAAGAVLAWRRRLAWHRPLLVGAAVAASYLGLRITTQQVLSARVAAEYPVAERVQVFPSVLDPLTWRYVAVLRGAHALGAVRAFGAVTEQGRLPRPTDADVTRLRTVAPTLEETLAWARFPAVTEVARVDGTLSVEVSDLRYHLRGEPSLRFVVELDRSGRVTRAELERGGSVKDVFGKLRGGT